MRQKFECIPQCKSKTEPAAATVIARAGPRRSPYLHASAARAWPNMALQPTANGLPALGLHFILAQTCQAAVCG